MNQVKNSSSYEDYDYSYDPDQVNAILAALEEEAPSLTSDAKLARATALDLISCMPNLNESNLDGDETGYGLAYGELLALDSAYAAVLHQALLENRNRLSDLVAQGLSQSSGLHGSGVEHKNIANSEVAKDRLGQLRNDRISMEKEGELGRDPQPLIRSNKGESKNKLEDSTAESVSESVVEENEATTPSMPSVPAAISDSSESMMTSDEPVVESVSVEPEELIEEEEIAEVMTADDLEGVREELSDLSGKVSQLEGQLAESNEQSKALAAANRLMLEKLEQALGQNNQLSALLQQSIEENRQLKEVLVNVSPVLESLSHLTPESLNQLVTSMEMGAYLVEEIHRIKDILTEMGIDILGDRDYYYDGDAVTDFIESANSGEHAANGSRSPEMQYSDHNDKVIK